MPFPVLAAKLIGLGAKAAGTAATAGGTAAAAGGTAATVPVAGAGLIPVPPGVGGTASAASGVGGTAGPAAAGGKGAKLKEGVQGIKDNMGKPEAKAKLSEKLKEGAADFQSAASAAGSRSRASATRFNRLSKANADKLFNKLME